MIPRTMPLGNAPLVPVLHKNRLQESSRQQSRDRIGIQHAHPGRSAPQIRAINKHMPEPLFQINNI